ncbi:MAG: glycosyltransferase [Clostridia bacterium]|nr:glycosyltransferase [Clostridia bacterium]
MLDVGVSVALLAYKEAENLKELLPEIRQNLEKTGVPYDILVIDTQQTLDETPEVCRTFGAEYYNQEEPGFGGAFKTAIKKARREMFLILDGDGSHNPVYIPDMYAKFTAEHCDLVIGSRYTKGGKTLDSKSSIIMSRILNGVFRLCIGVRAKDISTDFRLYDTGQLKAVQLTCVNYDVLQEVLLKLKLNNRAFRIGEVPITFEKRRYGESKRRLIPFIFSYIRTLFRLIGIRIRH